MNQIDTLFGRSHEAWLAKLRKVTKRRAKRVIVAKAIRGVTKLVKLRGREITTLLELRERLLDYDKTLDEKFLDTGIDPKRAKLMLGRDR